MYKFILIVLMMAILAAGYIVFQDVSVSPGKANVEAAYDVITQVQDSVKDTAGEAADYIGRDGGSEYEGFEGLASKVWDWAKALMQWLSAIGIIAIPLNDFETLGRLSPKAQTSYCKQRKAQAKKAWRCAECDDRLPTRGFVWKGRFENFVMCFRFQDCVPGLHCDNCVETERH